MADPFDYFLATELHNQLAYNISSNKLSHVKLISFDTEDWLVEK